LRLQLDPDRMSLRVNINGAGDPFGLESVELDRDLAPQDLSAYARLILDILEGDPTLSIRGDEAEESWRIVEPILGAWAAGRVPLGTYPAGAEH
jgi:glucose-6-phosphate 1-dehydrogenase